MSKKIEVIVKDRNILMINENAEKGDYIDLKEINQLDNSLIEQLINNGLEEKYQKRLANEIKIRTEEKEKQYKENLNYEIENLKLKLEHEKQQILSSEQLKYANLNQEYIILQNKFEEQIKQKELEIINNSQEEIINLKNKLKELEENNKKDNQINYLKLENESNQRIQKLKEEYDEKIREKDRIIDTLNRNKASLNVKQIGEDLEIFCDNEVKEQMQNGFFNCTWKKDNEVIKDDGEKKGSKADYIFKIYATENHLQEELVASVCLEMKDENPESINKQTNEHYYKALDKNRNKKECDYAILVSNLENDKPNSIPIFKVREYKNMYVVRPNYLMTFLHMITSLTTRYKDLILRKKEENLQIKEKKELIEEFQRIKNTYLDKPLEQLKKQIEDIITEANKISSASEKILKTCDGISTKYINDISKKLSKFEAKLEK